MAFEALTSKQKFKRTLRVILNWFKLFLALDFVGVSIALLFTGQETEPLSAKLVVFTIFFGIGIMLLVWFFKTKRRLSALIPVPDDFMGSSFYYRYPKFCNFMDQIHRKEFGTRYLTYSDKKADGSVAATKWIALLFLPIVPLYQERIMLNPEEEKVPIPVLSPAGDIGNHVLEIIPLNVKKNRGTYRFYYLFFLPAFALPMILFLTFYKKYEALHISYWWFNLTYFAWMMFVIFLSDRRERKWFLKRN